MFILFFVMVELNNLFLQLLSHFRAPHSTPGNLL